MSQPEFGMPGDDFMMDFENWILEHLWDNSHRHFPTGRERYMDPEWGALMRTECAKHSDVTWEQYCKWCQEGGGDDWFHEAE